MREKRRGRRGGRKRGAPYFNSHRSPAGKKKEKGKRSAR